MKQTIWTEPVEVIFDKNSRNVISGPFDALTLLTENWPHARGLILSEHAAHAAQHWTDARRLKKHAAALKTQCRKQPHEGRTERPLCCRRSVIPLLPSPGSARGQGVLRLRLRAQGRPFLEIGTLVIPPKPFDSSCLFTLSPHRKTAPFGAV